MDATADRALRAWTRRLGRLAASAGPEAVVAHVAAHVAAAVGARRTVAGIGLLDLVGPRPDAALRAATAPPVPPRPELLPAAYAAALPGDSRRRRGHVDTPWPVARRIAGVTLAGLADDSGTILDPAAGGGAFLLAAARHLVGAGASPRRAVARLAGTDLDPLAIEVAEAALVLLAAEAGAAARPRLACADALVDDHPLLEPGTAAAVVANPPFLSQLSRATARSRDAAARLRDRYGEAARAYADTANLFLLRALSVVRPGGRVGMILPESFLAARDARPARTSVARTARLVWVWRSVDGVFRDSSARVVAVVVARNDDGTASRHEVQRARGRDFVPMAPVVVDRERLATAPTWSPLVAGPGVPDVAPRTKGTLGGHCRATAGFRDEYYGLIPLVTEDPRHDLPRLVTCGLIDPARCWWGERPVRFARRTWLRPRIDVRRVDPASPLGAHLRRVGAPKVLLATQTKVLEAVADPEGRLIPATPVVCVLPAPGRLWHVGAALVSPVLSALAASHHAGAALSPDAIRMPARAVGELPAPADAAAWDEGAALFRAACEATDEAGRRAALLACAAAMCTAYGIDRPTRRALMAWWAARLPARAAPENANGQSSPGANLGARFSR